MKNIRNFVIISHVDHGKSTLADRFLELTGTIEKRKMHEQFLDMHPLERERGITIKLQPVRMVYHADRADQRGSRTRINAENQRKSASSQHESAQVEHYVLNLIDTPGHVDFYYEVSRSLAAVEGAILLVDATKGVQAQTLSNYNLAAGQNLKIIPVINKIDLPNARISEVQEQISELTGAKADEILKISAKMGDGVEDVLNAVIEKVPSPAQILPSKTWAGKPQEKEGPLQALIFDSKFDPYKGIIAYVRIFNGKVKSGDKVFLIAQKTQTEVVEVGYFKPELEKSEILLSGEIGYVATGLKDVSKVRVGDTITTYYLQPTTYNNLSLPGYEEPKPVVFASLYPRNADNYNDLKDALGKLGLQDSSLNFEPERSDALGPGFRCGFLGMLHAEIVSERLRRDFARPLSPGAKATGERGLDLIITSPSVEYEIKLKNKVERLKVKSASKLPDEDTIESIYEPFVEVEILTPSQYLGQIMKMMPDYRAIYSETSYLSSETAVLRYKIPLAEMIVDFYDRLKGLTSGYASMSYKIVGFEEADLVRLDIFIGGEIVEPFSKIVPRENAYAEGKRLVEKLKKVMPPQLFNLALQAAFGGRIIARETIKARRKNVTGYLYGGDVTRKKKLLEKQKRGKKRLAETGRVEIPQEVYLEILKK